ncbi:hypothetical protein J4226_05245 [Candidatus Pacearchaeota archaeon]|nr:hypothetical protein [Candidatus Pacearchaeota archaeon]
MDVRDGFYVGFDEGGVLKAEYVSGDFWFRASIPTGEFRSREEALKELALDIKGKGICVEDYFGVECFGGCEKLCLEEKSILFFGRLD